MPKYLIFILFLWPYVLYSQVFDVPKQHSCELHYLQGNTKQSIPHIQRDTYRRAVSEIEVTYVDFPPQAQEAFSTAAEIWETYIASSVPIRIEAKWVNTLPSNVLASTSATRIVRDFGNAPFSNTWYVIALAESLAGRDLNDGDADIQISFNSDTDWYLGTNASPGVNQYDLITIALHEIAHGLGFTTSMELNDQGEGTWGQGGFAYVYDLFLESLNGTKLVNPAEVGNPSALLRTLLTSNDLTFNTSTSSSPRLSSENPFENGVSAAHLDEGIYEANTLNALMTPRLGTGESIHFPGTLALEMLNEMGWIVRGLDPNAPLSYSSPRETIQVYPNPSSDFIYINNTNGEQYSIQNAKGVMMSKGRVSDFIDITQLTPGKYFLKIYDKNGLHFAPFIKW